MEVSQAFRVIADSVRAPEREASEIAYKEGGIIRRRLTEEPRVVLIGDSHGIMWSKVIDDVTEELGLTTSLWSMNGESVIMQSTPTESYLTKSERSEYDAQRRYYIEKWNPDIVIVAARWENISKDSAALLFQFLEAHAKNVLLVESPPVLDSVGNRSFHQYLAFLGIRPDLSNTNQVWNRFDLTSTQTTRDKLVKFALERSNFSFLPTADLFALKTGVVVASGRDVYYLDDDHLTDKGARVATSRIQSAIQNLLNGERTRFPIVSEAGEEANKTLLLTSLPRSE